LATTLRRRKVAIATASADVAAALDQLEQAGAVGIGQSSWGPTGYAFAPSPESANDMLEIVRRHPRREGVDIRICKGSIAGPT